jgi:hypothetical protein
LKNAAPDLRLALAPSRALAAAIVAAHALAAASLAAALPAAPGTALAALVLALGAATAWDRALLRGRGSVREIRIDAAGSAVLLLASGKTLSLAGRGRRRVNRFYVTLPVSAGTRRTVLVTADMLGPEPFRVLRLWALWGRTPSVASGQLPA